MEHALLSPKYIVRASPFSCRLCAAQNAKDTHAVKCSRSELLRSHSAKPQAVTSSCKRTLVCCAQVLRTLLLTLIMNIVCHPFSPKSPRHGFATPALFVRYCMSTIRHDKDAWCITWRRRHLVQGSQHDLTLHIPNLLCHVTDTPTFLSCLLQTANRPHAVELLGSTKLTHCGNRWRFRCRKLDEYVACRIDHPKPCRLLFRRRYFQDSSATCPASLGADAETDSSQVQLVNAIGIQCSMCHGNAGSQ